MAKELLYDRDFYIERNNETQYSAQRILSELKFYYSPKSCIDVGGGVGTFLKAAQDEFDIRDEDLLLLEGDYIEKKFLVINEKCYQGCNLDRKIDVKKHFDLAISLECAEHLHKKRAQSFVKDLCELSDVIMFSAAAKYQGGVGHINENTLTFWNRLFSCNGYKGYDIIRPIIQYEKEIPFWYRQNLLVFIRENSEAEQHFIHKIKWMPPLDMVTYDMVEPRVKVFDDVYRSYIFRGYYYIHRKLFGMMNGKKESK